MSEAALTVERLQQRYSIALPDDFQRYLVERAPAEDWWDDHGIIWWGRDRVKGLTVECPEPTPPEQINAEIENEASTYVVFADFLLWCYAYAICCSHGPNRGRVALIGGLPDFFVANSFSEFEALAATNSNRLHSPAADPE